MTRSESQVTGCGQSFTNNPCWTDIVNFHEASQLSTPPPIRQADTQQHKPFSKPTCSGQSLLEERILLDLTEKGVNAFGRVDYAILKCEASMANAILRYTYSSFLLDSTNRLKASRYKLTLGPDRIIDMARLEPHNALPQEHTDRTTYTALFTMVIHNVGGSMSWTQHSLPNP